MSARCCQIRTGVLFLGFFLGSVEVTCWVIFYTFRTGVRASLGYDGENEADLIAASVIVSIDITVNTLMICGANKDYSGRRKDLRRWGFMVPWVFVYGINILALFAASIALFYSLPGGYKALGLVALFMGIFVLIGHFAVLFFIIEQRADLDIFLTQQANQESSGRSGGADHNSPS